MSLSEAQQQQKETQQGVITHKTLYGMPEGHDARVLAQRARDIMMDDRVLMHVALDDGRLVTLKDLLAFFAPDVEVAVLPAWDCLPYDRVSPHNDIVAQRVAALSTLIAWEKDKTRKPRILLTTVNAATQRVTPKEALADAVFSAKTGGPLDMEELQTFLQKNGYMRTETVREAGEYAIRGGIIDLFPPGYEEPLRIDLFGIEVDSIKSFDPISQRTEKKLKSFNLYPATEFFLDEESIQHFRQRYRELFGVVREDDPLYEAVSSGRRYNGMDHWLPLFFERMDTLFDYAPDAAVMLDHHAEQARAERFSQIEDFFQSRKTLEQAAQSRKKGKEQAIAGMVYHPLPVEKLYIGGDEWAGLSGDALELSPFKAPGDSADGGGRKGRDFADIRALPDGDVLGAVREHIHIFQNIIPSPPRGEGQGEGEMFEGKATPSEKTEFARELRKQNTKAEQKLWQALRNRNIQNCKFRRQHPVHPYIVDFICLEKKLVVELDGEGHDRQYDYDQERTAFLQKQGFRVLRFLNTELDHNLEGVVQAIEQELLDAPLTPPLSPGGRGGIVNDKPPRIFIAAYSQGARERLRSMMDSAGIANIVSCESYADIKKLRAAQVGLGVLGLAHGFESGDLVVLTEQDILGDRLTRRAKKRKADNFLTEVSSINPGDLVTHIDHGVGRFEALETLVADGKAHDCLKIVYAGDDRLFVPVENIEVLSRFGSDEGLSQLDKLGGAGWQARKAKVKKDLMAIADNLLKIAAARQLKKADSMELAPELYQDFAAKFPYQETEDQLRSINAVIEDLGQPHPMDRLVCGDVGFGKTEVALRAAYVAAMNGAQVVVAVPTTLLARQHFNNFYERFKGMGLRVVQLSRMVSARDLKLAKDEVREGTANIIIGTHALFSKDVKFANLGLLIVDEEQRFGVKQKERLKELKDNVHVLTLTATPIPRTLQMSLTGVRELSLIATPPVDRLAVRTFVLPFDPMVVREAILREHYRGGQSFYVCPRVKDIEQMEEQIRELVPEVKVISAHGQMPATELDERMTAFYDGQYDVLLATNIIESGIDIPTANTMIVHRADMFGLAQLYQIRGRIGRSKVRAYAYLTYQPEKKLSDQAMKRLEVIETLDTLGSGFQLASHDMDIRGAGNLLGEEQSGHIKEIGVELYQQMLEDAVAAARAGVDFDDGAQAEEKWSPQINLGTSVLIPESYVKDLNVRMSLYRRLGDLENADDLENFAAELIDRFGDIPEEVENLLEIVTIKQLSRMAGIDRVDAGPKGLVIGFHNDSPPDLEGLMRWMNEQGGAVKLRHDHKLVVIRQYENAAQRVKGAKAVLKELSSLRV